MSTTADRLCAIIAEVNPALSPTAADFDQTFAQIGVDSLDFANVLLMVEEALGVSISDDESSSIATPAQLVAVIDAKKAG